MRRTKRDKDLVKWFNNHFEPFELVIRGVPLLVASFQREHSLITLLDSFYKEVLHKSILPPGIRDILDNLPSVEKELLIKMFDDGAKLFEKRGIVRIQAMIIEEYDSYGSYPFICHKMVEDPRLRAERELLREQGRTYLRKEESEFAEPIILPVIRMIPAINCYKLLISPENREVIESSIPEGIEWSLRTQMTEAYQTAGLAKKYRDEMIGAHSKKRKPLASYLKEPPSFPPLPFPSKPKLLKRRKGGHN